MLSMGMMDAKRKSVADFEGLVRTTARMYAPFLDTDQDDIAQELRVKVWQALNAYRPERVRTQTIEKYVFTCVRNRVKDLLKAQRRRRLPDGSRRFLLIGDMTPEGGDTSRFELEHQMHTSAEQVYAEVEEADYPLPSTLTELEVAVVRLLVLEFSQTEIAAILSVPRRRVRIAYLAVVDKLEDWRPTNGTVVRSEIVRRAVQPRV
jgi:RNA polymerase sigma factor (sigma-70 family)